MPRDFVELSIPNTKQTMGFYLNGDTPEAITPMTPFIQSGGPDEADYFLDYDVEIVSIDQTD